MNFGNLTIDNCTIEGNASAFGGGVFNDNGTLTIIESTIADNDGDSSGGAIYNFLGAVDVFGTVFSSNNVGSGSGGGIFNDSGTLSITDSTFSGNTTGNRGGGLFNGGGTVEVFGSTFLANTAIGFGGAIYNLDPGSVRVVNSTISDNESLDHGGGIRNLGGSLFLTNCTVTGNRSDMDDGGSGDGGGIATDVDTVCLYNTIVARNFRGTGGTLNDIDGQVDESGSFFNLVGDSATAGGLLDGINDNIIGADPILGSLQDNGGLTLTHALLVGSPAIDAGSNAQALDADNFPLESDQRGEGFPRLIDGNRDGTITVDIGAFEVGGWTVTSSDDVDDGVCDATHCSLREALNAANSTTGTDTITFNIPGSGPHTIQPGTFLPTITDPVLVDGYSQPGASPNTNPPGIGSNAVLKIELDGTNAGGASGLLIGGADCTVQGLVINRFEFAGIHILGAGASGNFVQGNFIGTDVTGSAALGNGLSNVIIQDAPNNTVGGSQAGARNIISGSDQSGVFLLGPGASGNILQGNFIGTDVTGTADVGNGFQGVTIQGAPGTIIGGSQAGEGNLISGNDSLGIWIFGTSGGGNILKGNLIGTDHTGTADLGNASEGVTIQDAPNNTVGGTLSGEGNVIAFNNLGGVVVGSSSADTTTSNSIRGNSIFENGSLGIDLGDDGVSLNDELDADTGPNNLQNFPVITYSTLGSTRIVGDFNSLPNEQFTLDFYAGSPGDPSNSDEGEHYLGSAMVMTDGLGDASFDVTLAETAVHGEYITATATDSLGNTSEFSSAVVFNDGSLDSWRSDMFDQADLMDPGKQNTVWGDSANPDGDRFANLIEYFMGFDPLVNDGNDAIDILADGNDLSLSYRKSKVAPDAVGEVEWSLNLLEWFSTDITEVVVEDLGAFEVIEATVPINFGENEKFMRLKVELD